jgi:hypothetical protein
MIRKGLDKHNGIYQDKTTQDHLDPSQELIGLWFLVGLGSRRLEFRNFVNRRSLRMCNDRPVIARWDEIFSTPTVTCFGIP